MPETTGKRRWGDRREGRRIRSMEAFSAFTPFIMPTRQGANNLFSDSIEVTEIDHWLRQRRQDGYKGLGMLHLLTAAYIRTASQMPGLNRFVSGQRIYARDTIDVVLTVKRALTVEASETTIKMSFTPRDTIYDVYEKFNAAIAPIKADTGDNGTEAVAGLLSRLPRVLLRVCLWGIRVLDYYDLMPKKLLEVSPFHGSLFITDLGSLGIPPVYHHLYNFGNLPIFMSFGAKRRVMELDAQGNPVERKYIDYTVDTDERIADGFYFATAFKRMKYFLRHPEQLEAPPETVKQDID